MGDFEDLDLKTAQDDPWSLPDNTYLTTITKSSIGETAKKDKKGWSIEYTVTAGAHTGTPISEWKQTFPKTDKSRSFVKQRMLSLGVPESKMDEVESKDFVGQEDVLVKIKKGRIFSVEVAPEGFVYQGDDERSGLNEFSM